MAQEALSLHIQGMLEDDEELPVPFRLEDIMSDPDFANAIAYLVVSIPDAKPRTVRVNVTVPDKATVVGPVSEAYPLKGGVMVRPLSDAIAHLLSN